MLNEMKSKLLGPNVLNKYASAIKFMFSKKATKNYKIFIVDLTLTQIDSEDFVILVAFLENMNFN